MSVNSMFISCQIRNFLKNLSYRQAYWILLLGLLLGHVEGLRAQTTRPTGIAPRAIVAAPFQNPFSNPFSDIAVISTEPTTLNLILQVYFNNSGMFPLSPSQSIVLGPNSFADMAVGSFNFPPVRDIAVVINSPPTLLTLFNSGGNFSLGSSLAFPLVKGATAVATGILQNGGTGRSDIVTASCGDQATTPVLQIFYSSGSSTFLPGPVIPLRSSPSSVATGDVDGDNIAEIVVSYLNTNQIEVFKNNGTNTAFNSIGLYSVGEGPTSVALGILQDVSLNNDIAVTNGGNNTLSVLLNTGNGTFLPAVQYPTQDAPADLVITNLDGTGFPFDIAVCNQAKSTVSLFINNGNGTFGPAINQNANSGPISITAANLLFPNTASLAVANFTANYFSIIEPVVALATSSPNHLIPSIQKMKELTDQIQFIAKRKEGAKKFHLISDSHLVKNSSNNLAKN